MAGATAEGQTALLRAAQAYEQIRAMILDGALTPGSPLSVPALASRLGMSRSPVREAVQRLIHDELATHVAHRGAVVAHVDATVLDEVYTVKEPLEGLATRMATMRMTLDDEQRLRDLLTEHERLLSVGAPASAHAHMDLTLHSTIHLIAGNSVLASVLAQFSGRTNLAFPSLWASPEMARMALDEHREIVEAMVSGDAAAAEHAACRHVARIRLRWARRQHLVDTTNASRPARKVVR